MTNIEVRELMENEYHIWNEFVDLSPEGTIFQTSDWLLSCGKLLDLDPKVIGFFEDGIMSGGLSFFTNKGRGLTRLASSICSTTPYGGIIIKRSANLNIRENEHERLKIMNNLRIFLESYNYDLISLVNSPELIDIRPFIWNGWRSSIRYTYYLDLNNIRLSKDVKRNIKKAIKNDIVIERSDDIHKYYKLFIETFSRQGLKVPVSKNFLVGLFDLIRQKENGVMWFAETQSKELAAAEIFIFDNKRVYRWTAASDANLRKSGAYSLLLSEVLEDFQKMGFHQMNLMAANTPQLAEFITGFNPSLVPYFGIEKLSKKYQLLNEILKFEKLVLGK